MARNAVRMETAGARVNSHLLAPCRHVLFLEEELDAVGRGLQEAEGPHPVRAQAELHEGQEAALGPGGHGKDREDDAEEDEDLDHVDDEELPEGERRRGGHVSVPLPAPGPSASSKVLATRVQLPFSRM